jgi:hypothetical protein
MAFEYPPAPVVISPPANKAYTLDEQPAKYCRLRDKVPKDVALPVVAIVMYDIVFALVAPSPPANTPLVDDEHPAGVPLVACVKFPNDVALPVVAIVM